MKIYDTTGSLLAEGDSAFEVGCALLLALSEQAQCVDSRAAVDAARDFWIEEPDTEEPDPLLCIAVEHLGECMHQGRDIAYAEDTAALTALLMHEARVVGLLRGRDPRLDRHPGARALLVHVLSACWADREYCTVSAWSDGECVDVASDRREVLNTIAVRLDHAAWLGRRHVERRAAGGLSVHLPGRWQAPLPTLGGPEAA